MFKDVQMAPPDAILGLKEAFAKDPNPDKIYLGAGVYRDEDGRTPVLASVKEAERRILENEPSKEYLPIDGRPEYGEAVQNLMFGPDHKIMKDGRVLTAQTPGGTGALRVAGDFLKSIRPEATVWLSKPTWPNHPQIMEAAGLAMKTYPYFDQATNGLDFEGMIAGLGQVNEGDVVLLQGCCHNPTGVDPSPEQWSEIGDLLLERQALPMIDIAYQGFSFGVREDAMAIKILGHKLPELIICSSFSKNFALYNERVGALTIAADSQERLRAITSQVKRTIRANYSNPPAHGGSIVTIILNDAALRQQWEDELATMRERIHRVRRQFAEQLDVKGVELHPSGNAFISHQRGMFSFSRLTGEQVAKLRNEHSIYIVASGRLNVAGLTNDNLPRLCKAISEVL